MDGKFTILVLVVIFHALSHEAVEARRPWNKNMELRNRFLLKTIKRVDGDIMDCVDIYKQPAFDNPLLQNHTIQMHPSTYPLGMEEEKNSPVGRQQLWQKNEECPPGTIPILRKQMISYKARRHVRNLNNNDSTTASASHEYAVAYVRGEKYYGASASINVWNPHVETPNEFSLSQIWLNSGTGDGRNSIEAGWTVYPNLYGDNKTRTFIFWTSDNYMTGCYNLECSGFVQISSDALLGGAIAPVSLYQGDQFMIDITIFKDQSSGNWWLTIQNTIVGYWPGSLFTDLADSAEAATWGGEVVNRRPGGRHTTTQMGSGHFPGEGFTKASFFRYVQTVDATNTLRSPRDLSPIATVPRCYDVHIAEDNNTDWGSHFFLGGPGGSQTSP